jgi:uncharacterized membrane protein
MNWAHAHLILNHAPVMGAVFCLALLAWGLARRSDDVNTAALLGWVITALSAGGAYLTGSYAGDLVQDLPGVSAVRISAHEDAALLALIAAIAAGVVALAGLWLAKGRKPLARWPLWGCFVLGVVTCALMARAANLGGEIRLPEARPGFQWPAAPAARASESPKT